jgi:hypothetical protein
MTSTIDSRVGSRASIVGQKRPIRPQHSGGRDRWARRQDPTQCLSTCRPAAAQALRRQQVEQDRAPPLFVHLADVGVTKDGKLTALYVFIDPPSQK